MLHVRLEIISIFLYFLKRKHFYQFASGVKPSSLSARVFAANQSGPSLSYSVVTYSDGAIGSSVYGVNRDAISSVSFALSVFSWKSIFPCV